MVRTAPGSTTARWRWSQVTPARFRKVCLFAVWALVFIIVSGAAVRLTGSGLGCKDWPTCSVHPNVKPWRYHEFVEFGNRLVTLALTVAIIAAEKDDLIGEERTEALRHQVRNLVFDRTIKRAGHNDIYARSEFHDAMHEALTRLKA